MQNSELLQYVTDTVLEMMYGTEDVGHYWLDMRNLKSLKSCNQRSVRNGILKPALPTT